MPLRGDRENSGEMVQEPQTIAELPLDITGSLGNILASDVFAVVGSQRKKRSELALAIDRQGVNIYDVRQSRLVASYAVSPQAIFTCPPCSFRYKPHATGPAQLVTYCSIKLPKPRIICFTETLDSMLGTGSPIATTTIDLQKNKSPVLHLELISVANAGKTGSANNLLVIHQDGEISCHSGQLGTEIWSAKASVGDGRQVKLATLTNIRQARKGLLKHREDVLASLCSSQDGEESSLIILLTRGKSPKHLKESKELALQVFSIRATDNNDATWSPGARLQKAVSIVIPEAGDLTYLESAFTLHVGSGTLYQQTPGAVVSYDITGLLPKLAHEVPLHSKDVNSLLRLSTHSLAISRQSSFSLIGLPYCSIQMESSVDALPVAHAEPLRLLSYFPPLNVIVAVKGGWLMAIQAQDPQLNTSTSLKRKQEGLLVDSLGKGSYSSSKNSSQNETSSRIRHLGTLLTSSKDKTWKDQVTELDDRAEHGHKISLSDLFVHEPGMHSLEAPIHVDQRKISYLLSKMFRVEREDPLTGDKKGKGMQLGVLYLDQDHDFDWLVHKGLLTTDRIENALKQEGFGTSKLHKTENLAPGALIRALARYRSLELLLRLLTSRVSLSADELASTLVVVIQRSNAVEPDEDSKRLTNGASQADQIDFTNGDSRHHMTSPHADATESIYPLLHQTLTRLANYPKPTIISALRSQLTKSDLLNLVDILRMEIARSGWLSPYDKSFLPKKSSDTPDHQLADITHLLNSTIDAIGAGGWITGSGFNDDLTENADTISYMKAEISAALEGIEEAVYLKGMLGEVLLCGKESLLPLKIKQDHSALSARNVPENIAPQHDESSALPLGLKLEKKVPVTKVGAGGELMERSKRDIGRLKSKMVGKYSFERIVL